MTRPVFARGTGTSPAGPAGRDGTDGLNGLPGVNAVANDTATAAYVSNPTSATAAALSASTVQLRGSVDPETGDHAIIVIKPEGDTRPGVFEWIINGPGTIFHLLIGEDAVVNQTYAITVGGDHPGNGILLNMKSAGTGLKIEQNETVTGVDSYGMAVHQDNANAPAAFFYTDRDGAEDVIRLMATPDVNDPAQWLLTTYVDTGTFVGGIKAATGDFEWRRPMRLVGGSLDARMLNDAVPDNSTPHVVVNQQGVDFQGFSGSPGTFWHGKIKLDGLAVKFTADTGFGGDDAVVMQIGYGGKIGWFGSEGIASAGVLGSAATDAATTQARVNAIATLLINAGLGKVA